MSAVKTLALGVWMTGSLAASAFAGSIKHGRHEAIVARPPVAPTALVYAAPVAPATPPVSLPVAAPRPINIGAENMAPAGSSSYGQAPSGYGFGTGGVGLSLGYTGSGGSSNAPTASGSSAPSSYNNPGSSSGASSANHSVAAFINFGNGTYSESQALTTGNPQAWYLSPTVQHAFGGTPTAAQQSSFIAEVLQTVHDSYALSGLNVSLTTDPTQNYAHTMSVVSGASYGGNAGAIGVTDVGSDGFAFIDKFGSAKNADELAKAIGHNLAHELMHAFGIGSHPDPTGTFIDGAAATWSTLTNPDLTFSPQAAQMLAAKNFLAGPGKDFTQGTLGQSGLEIFTVDTDASPVPEPSTMALWGLAGGLVLLYRRRNRA